jgi:hypothetical protein
LKDFLTQDQGILCEHDKIYTFSCVEDLLHAKKKESLKSVPFLSYQGMTGQGLFDYLVRHAFIELIEV